MADMTTATEPTKPWRPHDTLAARLVLVRREAGLTQRKAAQRTGVTFGEWQSMENGASARGIDTKIARICLALDVDREWLMWGGPLASGDGPTGGPGAAAEGKCIQPTPLTSGFRRTSWQVRVVQPTTLPAAA